MATINSTTALTATEYAEARALRDELLTDRGLLGLELGECGRTALAMLPELVDFAASWDAMAAEQAESAASWEGLLTLAEAGALADDLAVVLAEPESTPPAPVVVFDAPRERARAKAAYHLAGGLQLRRAHDGAWLVPSGTRGGVVHRVAAGQCSCEAASKARACWHIEAVEQVESGVVAPLAA